MRQMMADHGIDVSGLRTSPELQTSMSMHAIGADGERRPIHVVGANRLLGVDDVAVGRGEPAREPSTSVASTSCPGCGAVAPDLVAAGAAPAPSRASTSSAAVRATPTSTGPRVLPHVDWFLPNDAQLLAAQRRATGWSTR